MASQAQQKANPIAVIRQNLDQMDPQLAAALPAHVTVDKFKRVAMTAIQNNEKLAGADRQSLFGSIVRLAQDGLLPDGREAAIVMFGNKAQAMPMIAGVLKKVRQSGDVAKINAFIVHENDTFIVKYGFDEDVEHVPPPLNEPRGDAIGAYATAVLKNGERLLEVMSLEEIEKVRSVSRAKNNGPWVTWWGEMARKTVMRRLSKRLPMSTDLEDDVFRRDETMSVVIDNEPIEPKDVEPAEPASRLEALEHQITEDEPVEGEPQPEAEAEAEAEPEQVDTPEPTPTHYEKMKKVADDCAAEEEKGAEDREMTMFEHLMQRIKDIKSKADLKDADTLFQQKSALLDDKEYQTVDDELNAARKRLDQ